MNTLYSVDLNCNGEWPIEEQTITVDMDNSEQICERLSKRCGQHIECIDIIEADKRGIIMSVWFNDEPAKLYLTNQGAA